MAALLTTTSMPPYARSAASNNRRTAAGSLASAGSQVARPPAFSMSPTTSRASSRLPTELTTTLWPSRARRRAVAAPMPPEELVTIAILTAFVVVRPIRAIVS